MVRVRGVNKALGTGRKVDQSLGTMAEIIGLEKQDWIW